MPYKFKGKRDCTQSDGTKGKYQTVKRNGSKRCYKSEKQYKSAQAWAHENDDAEEEVLREYIRTKLVTEITKLPKEYFTVIDNALMASKFWAEPNDDEDDPDGEGPGRTPAAVALESALQGAFDELDLGMEAFVTSHFTGDPDYMLHPEHPAYPNRWLIDGRWYVSKQKPGQNVVDLQIMLGDQEMGFDANDVDPNALVRHISQTVRHELVHYNQMKKQAANKNLSDTDAFEEMLNDPKQIPDSKTGTMQDYLRSHIEIDAHAHDAAEELLAVYGEEGANDILRGNIDLKDPKLPNTLMHYHEILSGDDKTLHKLYSKIYSYMQYILEQ